jgi:glycosyltransferase involved in cell wall biosynthesis
LNPPRVSVVVSHFDRRAFLLEALDSIAAQTFQDFEVLVVNDGGPSAATLVEGWARGRSFATRYVQREANGGVAAVRNTGVRAARGSRIAYLDDDDLWDERHLECLVALLDDRPDCALAYGDALVVKLEPPGPRPGAPRTWPERGRLVLAVPFDRDDLARDDFVVPGGMLHMRALYDEIGPFDEELFVSDDWDWLLRAARVTEFARLPRVVVTVRIRTDGANLSADRGARRRAALDAIERRHGTPRLEPKTFWEVAETYARRGNP